MKAKRAVLLFIILILTCPPVFAGNESNPVMPEELIEEAGRHNCEPFDDYYKDRPGRVEPPFAYGYLPGKREDSAVFWCRDKSTRKTVLMVYIRDKNKTKFGCPPRIEWINPPSGLLIYMNPRDDLSNYHYWDNLLKYGPRGVHPRSNSILSTYGGTSTIFYCYKGKWLIRQLH
jgi:hypothetical protein